MEEEYILLILKDKAIKNYREFNDLSSNQRDGLYYIDYVLLLPN